jgi:hypothetical protein
MFNAPWRVLWKLPTEIPTSVVVFSNYCKLYQQIPVNYTSELRQRFEATKCVYEILRTLYETRKLIALFNRDSQMNQILTSTFLFPKSNFNGVSSMPIYFYSIFCNKVPYRLILCFLFCATSTHCILYKWNLWISFSSWMRPYHMVATDVSGVTCCPLFHGLLQNNLQIKIKWCPSACLPLSLVFVYVIAYDWESGRYLFGDFGTLVWFRAGVRKLSLLQSTQTLSVTHPASCPMANCISVPQRKIAGAWIW